MEAGRHFRSDDALDVFLESHAPQRLGLFIPQRNKGTFLGEKKENVQLRTSSMGTPMISPMKSKNTVTEQPRCDLRRRLLLKKAPSHPSNPMMGKRENIPNYSWLMAPTGQTSVQLAQSMQASASIM